MFVNVRSKSPARLTGGLAPIAFNRAYMTGTELSFIERAHDSGRLSGDGDYTDFCARWLETRTNAQRAMLTPSCTASLELCAMLLDLQPGDEVIMPSYTFVSTANAFVRQGAVPVFVDIRPDTFNIDETLIESAVTDRTRAVCVVHYGGVAAEMDAVMAVAARHGLAVVEDAAQAILCSYRGRPLGAIGDFGTVSFHETKNLTCGEGGALLFRDGTFVERAEILREKGTDRRRMMRGQADKYTWVDVGSSFLLGEVPAAFLAAQFEHAEQITRRRIMLWQRYREWALPHQRAGTIGLQSVPDHCVHNGHLFALLLPDRAARTRFIEGMLQRGILTVFHYVPLHSSPAGRRYARGVGSLRVTDQISDRLVRLPLWLGMEAHMDRVLETADEVLTAL